MFLEAGDLLAIIIALAGSTFVMVWSIRSYGYLYRENRRLRERVTLLSKENFELKRSQG